MRKELLNQRPTSALRGQSPLCESVGTGHTSTHPSIFTKVLLVLLTMLLLPSTAWGQGTVQVTKTISFKQSVATVTENINNSTIPTTVKEVVGGKEYNYNSRAIIIDEEVIDNYSCIEDEGATFTLKDGDADNSLGFTIRIPGTYPIEPSSVNLSIAYDNTDYDEGDNYCAVIGVSNNEDNHFKVPSTEENASKECTILFKAGEGNVTDFGTLKTIREKPEELDIMVYLTAKNDKSTTFNIKEVKITYNINESDVYNLSVVGIPVTSVNKDDVLSDGKVSFTPADDNTSATLTLNNAKIGSATSDSDIEVFLDDFILKIGGTCTINGDIVYSGSNLQTSSILISNTNAASLTVSGISGFGNCSWSDGLYLSADIDGIPTDIHYEPYESEAGYMMSNYGEFSTITFSTTKPSESIWIGETQVGANGKFDGIEGVSFNSEKNILTLNNANLGGKGNIISSLPNLTIKLTGEDETHDGRSDLDENSYIISTNSSATLTFTTDGDNSLCSTIDNFDLPWKGFAGNPTFENKLVFLQAAETMSIQVLQAPTMSYSSGNLTFGGLSDGYNNTFDCYYTITYEDGEGNIETTKYEPGEGEQPIPVSMEEKPCTVTAYVTYKDKLDNTTQSETAIGKYFGIADKTIDIINKPIGSDFSLEDIEIIPATEKEGVSFSLEYANSQDVISYSNEGIGKKFSIAGIGRCEVGVDIIVANNATIQVLNPLPVEGNRTADGIVTIVESYNVWVAGTLITSANAANVLGGSTASVTFDAKTSTLKLNNAYIVTSNSAGIKSGLSNLNVVLSGGQSEVKCTGDDYYAFEGTAENATITFSSSAASVGYLDITTAGYNKFFKDITPAYDGITHFDQTSVNSGEYFYLIRKSPWTGSGTEDDPYLVSTTTELKTISTYVNQGIVMNYSFKLNNDIDWSQETSAFTSIGVRKGNYTIFSFEGTFDGNNKTISNLTSENGLFNYVMNGGSIKNLTLTGCTVIGGSTGEDAAGLVADFRSSGKIEKCSVKNSSITNNNYTNITSAGGIVGYMTNGTIDNCSIENVTITMGGSPTYTQSAGGIVGHTYESTTITNCEVKVNAGTTKITNTAETDQALYAGAIVGWRERQTTLTSNTYQAGVVIETRKGTDAAVTKSGNKQRGLGDGDDVVNGAELAGVKKITVTKNDKGTVEYMSNIYREDGSDIYVLPYSLSGELTIIKGTSSAGYDEPTIAIKTVTNSTPIIPDVPDAAEDTSDEGLFYTEWSFQMPNDDATASIMFAINLAKEARNFVIAGRDYTGDPLPVTEIKTTLDALDGSNPAFIELQSGTHFNVTGYKKSDDTDLGTTTPTNAGNYKVVVEGTGDCVGTVTLPFIINRLTITPEITVTGWIYGSYDATENGPTLTEGSNPENGEVTYYFKKDTDEEFHEMELSSTTDAGTYLVIATVAETGNYEGGSSEEVEFVIDQYDLGNATVTLDPEELVYDGKEHTINVTKVMAGDIEVDPSYYEVSGNTGKEAKTYSLIVTAKTEDISGNEIKNNFKGSKTVDWVIKNRTVTTDELGLSEDQPQATYYIDTEDLEVPDGVVANIITSVSDGKATTQRISYIPKNVPVFVELTTSSEESFTEIPEDPSELPLKGTAEPKDVTSISGGTVFVLYKGEFVKSTSGTIPAHRCYLLLPNDVAAGTRAFGIIRGVGGSNGSTAIKSIEIDNTPSTIENWYDMRGRRIEKPTKTGIYIKDGKKVVINNK